ncbi:MAG: hypothetical protein WC254_02060 [Candidatus Woesearchaeota archaeon]|jgi:hypothetical protein
MRVRKTISKIASIGAAATMVGATLMGAAMAADLSEYPNMFIEDGTFNGILVVGADARAEDVIGITNIATSLQTVSVQTTVVSEAEADTEYSVSEGYELCNRNLYPGYNISACEPSVDDSDLDLLADDVYHDAEGSNDNDEKYTQQILFQNQGTGQFVYTQDDEDAPVADTYIFIDNSNTYLYNFTLQFDSYISVENASTALAGDDLEGTTLNIQGRSYTVTDAKIATGGVSGNVLDQIEMQSGDSVVWMSEGESLTRTVDGVEHTVELMDVSADATDTAGSCGFKVDGTELWVDVKDTETVNGVTLGVTDAKRVNIEAGNQDVCEVAIGAGEVTIRNGDEVQFNNEDVDGTLGSVRHSSSLPASGELRWTGFDIVFAPDTDEVYLASGDEYIDPMFGNFKFVFAGVETGGVETIEFVAGSTSAEIRFKNEDGRLVEIPLSADSSAAAGEASNEVIFWGNEAPTATTPNQDELVYLQNEKCTGTISVVDCQGAMFLVVDATKLEAHLVQITNIDTNDNELNFDDLTYGTTDDDVSYVPDPSSGSLGTVSNISLKSAGAIGLIVNETGNYINFTSTGARNGANITTLNRGKLTIVDQTTLAADTLNQAVGTQVFHGMKFSEYNDGSLAASKYLGVSSTALNITAFYDDVTDNSIEWNNTDLAELGTAHGWGRFDESDESDNFEKFYTKKGTLITYDREDQQSLTIEQPYDTAYAKVYIAPTEASTAETSSNVATTIVPISVSAVKLDTEVSSVTNKNIVAVGGPCANSVVAELMGNPADCSTALGIESGQALIKLFENGDYVALVVAGQDAMDTRLAAQIVSNWEDYSLTGDEMVATTVSESSLSVESVQ